MKRKEILVMEVPYSGDTNSWISSIPYLLIYLSIRLSIYPAAHPSTYLPTCLSIYQAILERQYSRSGKSILGHPSLGQVHPAVSPRLSVKRKGLVCFSCILSLVRGEHFAQSSRR